MPEESDTIRQLKSIIETLHGEWTQMQIMGRGLSPEERRRSDQIYNPLPKLREALEILTTEAVSEGEKRRLNRH